MAKKQKVKSTGRNKAILAADLHLLKKPGMWAGRAEISGDDIFALKQIAELAIEKDADLYLLGDVLDSATNLPRPIVAAQQALGTLADEGRVFFIQGQHELIVQAHYENHPWLSLIRGTQHIGGASFEFMGCKAFALDYFPAAFEALEFSKIPADTDILMLHGTSDTAMPIAPHFSMKSLEKFKNLKIVFAGDYHQPLELVSPGNVRLFYTGSTWQISANEPREKSVLFVEKSDGVLSINRLPLRTRKILKLSELYNIDGELDVSSLTEEPDETLPKELRMPVLLIDVPADQSLYEELAQNAHLHTTSSANPDVVTRENADSELELSNDQILQMYADKEAHPEKFAFTLDIIENSVEPVLKRLKDKFKIEEVDLTIGAESQTTEINLDHADPEPGFTEEELPF